MRFESTSRFTDQPLPFAAVRIAFASMSLTGVPSSHCKRRMTAYLTVRNVPQSRPSGLPACPTVAQTKTPSSLPAQKRQTRNQWSGRKQADRQPAPASRRRPDTRDESPPRLGPIRPPDPGFRGPLRQPAAGGCARIKPLSGAIIRSFAASLPGRHDLWRKRSHLRVHDGCRARKLLLETP